MGLNNSDNMTYPEYYDIDPDLYQRYEKNRAVSEEAFYFLILAYGVLIAIGTSGNLLVLLAVIKEKKMRTARNTLIATLALADLTLCIFTTPVTMIDILTKYWPLGAESFLLCKVVRAGLAVTVFFSSFTITIIALDRHRFIVTPAKRQVTCFEASMISIGCFALSLFLAAPIGVFTHLKKMFDEPGEFDHISFCVETFPPVWRVVYSLCASVIQHILPSIIVSVAYTLVSRRLADRLATTDERQKLLDAKRRKNNSMLIAVAVTHFVSWLPLNLFNIVTSILSDQQRNQLFSSPDTMICLYSVCHMAGMSSACFNPFLYAFLNENFRKEFVDIFNKIGTSLRLFSSNFTRTKTFLTEHCTRQ